MDRTITNYDKLSNKRQITNNLSKTMQTNIQYLTYNKLFFQQADKAEDLVDTQTNAP